MGVEGREGRVRLRTLPPALRMAHLGRKPVAHSRAKGDSVIFALVNPSKTVSKGIVNRLSLLMTLEAHRTDQKIPYEGQSCAFVWLNKII